MSDQKNTNNNVRIAGKVAGDFKFSHTVYCEGFYIFELSIQRRSEVYDIIPIMISERLIDVTKDYRECYIEVTGQLRTFSGLGEKRNSLFLSVFAREVFIFGIGEDYEFHNHNYVYMDGFVCKPPVYRITPTGREIADILVAVNRMYNKSDYIPCICWGRNAKFADSFKVGGHIQVWGRLQSREYYKRIDENEFEKRVTYEVSVNTLEYVLKNTSAD